MKLNVYVCDLCGERFEPSSYEESMLKTSFEDAQLPGFQQPYNDSKWSHVCPPCKRILAAGVKEALAKCRERVPHE